ncbi:hypothetical protein EC988_003450 [Linderina pennispora]|nr:hypothetical protein EC988_003450 [Linderina pennispora]
MSAQPASSQLEWSGSSTSDMTETLGDKFIKETDSLTVTNPIGVGQCALHPCLSRRATVSSPPAEEEEADDKPGLSMRVVEQQLEQRLDQLVMSSERQSPPSSSTLLGRKSSSSSAAMVTHAARNLMQSAHELGRGSETPTVGLVETAVSVREVSKRIGRTVVQVGRVRRIMIVTKPNDTGLVSLTRDLALWLLEQGLSVFVEERLAQQRRFHLQRFARFAGLQYWTMELCAEHPEMFDFVVTLGGDGTVLYTSWLFQRTVPPIIPFHLGSLGFLTVFDHHHARRVLASAIHVGVRINLRMRFTCTVYRLADAADAEAANVLADAADCNRAIDHETATRGIRGGEELCSAEVASGKIAKPTRSFSGTKKERRRRRSTEASSDGSVRVRRRGGRRHVHQYPDSIKCDEPVFVPPEPLDLPESEWEDVPQAYQGKARRAWRRGESFQVLNELVVDRGPSPYLSQIELYGDGNHLTTVEADGLCLATPTGSTAYSLAAGGSLVHPEIPAIMVTPICPHTLSFRPMLLPDSMVVRVVLPPDSRNTAWASFDGRHRIELRRGDHIQITASKYPLPTVCASQSQTQDWMASLSRCLNWNERKRQKKFAGEKEEEEPDGDEGDNAGDEDEGDSDGRSNETE